MCPSTDAAAAAHEFAADVLHKLLRHIAVENVKNADGARSGRYVFHVSSAWTDGPMMYVVYRSPPLTITWGLVRDTRGSLVDPGPWNDTDNPALYYYLLDFEEGWSGALSPRLGEGPDVIHWRGDRSDDLPQCLSDVPAAYRYTPPPVGVVETQQNENRPAVEPRRYADPDQA